jgi:hypothetical protein
MSDTATVNPLLIVSGSPGSIGDPEIWIDEAALGEYAAGRAQAAISVSPQDGQMIGATICFSSFAPGLEDRAAYEIGYRRRSHHNYGQPYYVARRAN